MGGCLDQTPLSTEHNLTPLQLWVQGNLENACFQQTVSNNYGILPLRGLFDVEVRRLLVLHGY